MNLMNKVQIKNVLKLLFLVWVVGFLQSCSDDEDQYAEWREKNETAFEKTGSDLFYQKLTMEGLTAYGQPNYIYYKVITKGPSDGKSPVIGSTVKVKYKGSYVVNEGMSNKGVFDDKTEDKSASFVLGETSPISGFKMALQHMKPGDKWEIIIPWILAYGAAGSITSSNPNGILPYSTLKFEELEMISFK